MPVMSGTQAALEIRCIAPQVKILFVTIHDEPELIARLRPFTHGLGSKSAGRTELISMVTRLAETARGNPYIRLSMIRATDVVQSRIHIEMLKP
jgi:DNA-binding NarL/FixJ family response regulator